MKQTKQELEKINKLKEDGLYLKRYKNQTPAMCLAAVEQNGYALQYVKNQTKEICLTAVQQNGRALFYVKNQIEEICLKAVQQAGYSLQYVEKQTEKICLSAVRQNGLALRFVKKQTPKICLEAVKNDYRALQFVKEQTPQIVKAAITQDVMAFRFIKFKENNKTNGEETDNKEFWLPVTWQVWDKVCVKAKTLEEAIKWVKENIDELPLGTDPELIDGTYHLDDGDGGDASIEDTIHYFKENYPSSLESY